jgi:hypothetical protein
MKSGTTKVLQKEIKAYKSYISKNSDVGQNPIFPIAEEHKGGHFALGKI